MNTACCVRAAVPLARAAVAALLAFVPCETVLRAAAAGAAATLRTESGLHVVSYVTLQGTVRVSLPDDLATGDTVSGTIAIEPAGNIDAERAANAAKLRGTVIEIGGQKAQAAGSAFRLRVADATQGALPVLFTVAGIAASRQRAAQNVPLASRATVQNQVARMARMPGRFDWPPTWSQGARATVAGPFDGDATTTRVSVGGVQASVLAESPRQAVLQVPAGMPPGPTTLQLTENDITVAGRVRSVQLQLTAPKTDLRSGERTDVSIAIFGLQDLEYDVPLVLRTGGTVRMDGGNLQRLDVHPGDPRIAAGGEFRTTRGLTAVAAGAFEVAAEIVWAQPAANWFVGKTVHVEGEPGGQPGRWRVPVILPGGKERHGIYFGGDKPPALHFCQWIEIKNADERDGIDYVTEFVRAADPTQPKPASKPADTKPVPMPPGPAATGGPRTDSTEPSPCKPGDTRVLSSETKTFTLLDGKAERILHVYSNKDGASAAAKEFGDFLDAIAAKGGKASDYLPDGDGAGGATVDFLLKYLEHGGAVMKLLGDGKVPLDGATEFTATMDVGLRDVEATCTTFQICRVGAWVTEKKFTQTETKRRETFVKKATLGDDNWLILTKGTKSIDAKTAADWANDFFKEQASILKGHYDDLQAFKDRCK